MAEPVQSDPKQVVQRWVPQRLIETAKAAVPARLWDRCTRRILYPPGLWKRSRAFCVPNDYSGAIRVNLKGREPDGLISPGAEYDALVSEISDALLELEHVDTGRPVVREVVRTLDRYAGENATALPDLLVLWTSESPVTDVRSPRVGTIRLASPEQRTGAHRPRGIFIASGPRIPQHPRLEEVQLLDLAPTILNLSGVDVPPHFDGSSIPGLGSA